MFPISLLERKESSVGTAAGYGPDGRGGWISISLSARYCGQNEEWQWLKAYDTYGNHWALKG
jgi:hypothetical protein